jgi:hypothetical protein
MPPVLNEDDPAIMATIALAPEEDGGTYKTPSK